MISADSSDLFDFFFSVSEGSFMIVEKLTLPAAGGCSGAGGSSGADGSSGAGGSSGADGSSGAGGSCGVGGSSGTDGPLVHVVPQVKMVTLVHMVPLLQVVPHGHPLGIQTRAKFHCRMEQFQCSGIQIQLPTLVHGDSATKMVLQPG